MSSTESFAAIAKRLMEQFPTVMPEIIRENFRELKDIQATKK
jgi:hypothetical protein